MSSTRSILAVAAIITLGLAAGSLITVDIASAGPGNNGQATGNPFVALQNQIDALQAQIDELGGQTGIDLEEAIIGQWNIHNLMTDQFGEVAFYSDGTFEVLDGAYQPALTKTSGTWAVFENRYIAVTSDDWTFAPYIRAAYVTVATPWKIVHHTQGHTHAVEVLTPSL